MSNNNNKTSLQFTKLTADDIGTHEDLYIELLVSGKNDIPNSFYTNTYSTYYNYAMKELQKAVDLFHKTFK